jgi:uncharacterized protein YdeI (YjbR/CyaY-like superfamily)
MAKLTAKSFSGTLERMRSRLGWTIVYVPFDVFKVWGSRGNFRIKGTINGFQFRTSLFPTGRGTHFLMINKQMQRGAKVVVGALARFKIEPDVELRVAAFPAELKRVLDQDKALRRWFDKLPYSIRKWIGDWVAQPKNFDARARRSEQVAEQLMSTMEAERELPPLLQLAFTRTPGAMAGWQQMSAGRRRANLLAIFYYRTPEARARRLAKVVEEAVACGKRKHMA